MPPDAHTNTRQPGQLNLPCQELLPEEKREEFIDKCFPLYEASMTGNWKVAEGILDDREELVRFSISRWNETALHVAVHAGNTLFVKNLVKLMDKDDMELQNSNSDTALCIAAVVGHVEVARILVEKHKSLVGLTGSQEKTPLYMAALSGNGDMVQYLYECSNKMTDDSWTAESRGCILIACVEAELFYEALKIVEEHPQLAVSEGSTILQLLARKPHSLKKKENYILKNYFLYDGSEGHVDEKNQAIQLLKNIWKNIVTLPTAKIDEILRGPADQIMEDKYPSRVLFVAAEMGNTAFIVVLIRQYPERVLELNDNKQSIFHVAISHRHVGVYCLLHEIGSIKASIINLEDEKENNILHLVGILETKETTSQYADIKGPIQEMRQELGWFKEIRRILPPSLREKKNKDGKTARELFVENHKKLVLEGVDWITKASSNLMVAAVLTAGISFAASITFAGGYIQEIGKPVLSQNKDFEGFVELNAMSFLFASTSILFLLSINSSDHSGRDFLWGLTIRFSMATLFLSQSLMYMVLAFSNNFTLILSKKIIIIWYFFRVYSLLVGMLFVYLFLSHFRLLMISTFQPGGLLFRPRKQSTLNFLNFNFQPFSTLSRLLRK
ncbi:hypothetical protein L1887_23806 [Cichorium endivia]|nr:hypothetical protein L1887_23806 [Cichorium endivia]